MMQNLTAIAYGIVGFAVLVTVGIVTLTKLADTSAVCATDYTYNASLAKCINATGGDPTTPTNLAYSTPTSIVGYLGTSGLAGWIPAVIAVAIGVLFIAWFSGRKKSY